MRELRRGGHRTFVSVVFRLPDEEPVFVGHYGAEPASVTAAQAVAQVRAAPGSRGFQVLVPRRIRPSEIVRVRLAPQGVGWRYYPTAHGDNRWPCDCAACVGRGGIKSRIYHRRVPVLQERWLARKAASEKAGEDK
ncbi:MAG: hypothetical protein AB7S41_12595 [Parvibaculaceae bacterium]